jgi:hypothetical protein
MLHDLAKTREHSELLRKLDGAGQNPVPYGPQTRLVRHFECHRLSNFTDAFGRHGNQPSARTFRGSPALQTVQKDSGPSPQWIPATRALSGAHERSGAHRAFSERSPERLRTFTNASGRSPEPPGSTRALRRSPAGLPSIAPGFGPPHDPQPQESFGSPPGPCCCHGRP